VLLRAIAAAVVGRDQPPMKLISTFGSSTVSIERSSE
jgi:hypothetical protein